MGVCGSKTHDEDRAFRIVHDQMPLFEETCCIRGDGRFMHLREYQKTLKVWIMLMEEMIPWIPHDRLRDAAATCVPEGRDIYASWDDHSPVTLIGISLERYPTDKSMEKLGPTVQEAVEMP